MNAPDSSPRRLLIVVVLLICFAAGCTSSSIRDFSFFRGTETSEIAASAGEGEYVNLTIWHEFIEDAQRISESTGKPILVEFTGSDWCSPCKRLKRDVFETADFKQWAHENVVLLELDYPRNYSQPESIKQQNLRLKEKYNISGFPTVLLLSSDGDVIGKIDYKKKPRQWIESANVQLAKQQVAHQFR